MTLFTTRISEFLIDYLHAIPDRIIFANSIMLDKTRNFREQGLCYKLYTWKEMGAFDILNNISEHVTLVQIMDSLGNVNHALSVVRKCISIQITKKTLPIESLS